jgi:hypothetical protein
MLRSDLLASRIFLNVIEEFFFKKKKLKTNVQKLQSPNKLFYVIHRVGFIFVFPKCHVNIKEMKSWLKHSLVAEIFI